MTFVPVRVLGCVLGTFSLLALFAMLRNWFSPTLGVGMNTSEFLGAEGSICSFSNEFGVLVAGWLVLEPTLAAVH